MSARQAGKQQERDWNYPKHDLASPSHGLANTASLTNYFIRATAGPEVGIRSGPDLGVIPSPGPEREHPGLLQALDHPWRCAVGRAVYQLGCRDDRLARRDGKSSVFESFYAQSSADGDSSF